MKTKNVAKGFGIASLCLGVAVSAFSGMMVSKDRIVVAEEAETIQTTDLVHTSSSATVEMATLMCTDPMDTSNTSGASTLTPVSKEHTGLRISSDEAYQATFQTVFKKNLRMKFRFPETYENGFYGNFNFRIADATDDSKFFDITYYVVREGDFTAAPCVQWGDEVRMVTSKIASTSDWHNEKIEGLKNYKFAPCFLTKSSVAERSDRLGILDFTWVGGVLTITTNTTALQDGNPKKVNMIPLAAFDDTYDTSKKDNGFVNKEAWGLPKMEFKNGYTITVSSSFDDKRTTDHGTDVLFTYIQSGETYDFSQETLEKDENMALFEESFEFLGAHEETTEGKFYLGWRNTETNALYPDYALAPKGDYEPMEISYDTLAGASLRIDASENGKSGIRFETLFDPEEYELIKDYLQEFGMLVAYTDTLIEDKDFTIENYKGSSGFAKVANTVGTHEYVDKEGNTYTAYSMAVVDIQAENYTRSYSARGYLVVKYTNGTTQLIYTDFNQEENSGVIEEIANLLRQEEEYNTYTDEEKVIIDTFAGVLVEPEEPVDPENPDQTEEPVDPENPDQTEEPVDPEETIE